MVDLAKIIRCPRCNGELYGALACARCGAVYERVDGRPVLIDFEDSIFAPADCSPRTVQPRGSAAGRLLERITFGPNKAAAGNLRRFLDCVAGAERPLVLVVGGGTVGSGAERLYAESGVDLVGTDVYPSHNVALLCDAHKLPFADGSFDGVIIQAVLEHVLDPAAVVAEVHRVLKPRGVVYAETPFIQQVHMGAYDFTRFTFSGHRWLFRHFEEIDAGAVLGPGTALLWSIFHYLRSLAGQKVAALGTALFAWVRLGDRTRRRRAVLDAACGVYFLGRRSERPLAPRDMPAYYEALG
jgi:SAM-dependent methyltransferase